jgi:signal transduction histidine kinase
VNKASKSLWIQLAAALVASSLVAVGTASVLLYERFRVTNSTFREHTLRNEARLITKFLAHIPDRQQIVLPPAVVESFHEGKGEYAIVDSAGNLLAGSPGRSLALNPPNEATPLDYFILERRDGPPYYGVSVASQFRGKPVWVQVAFVASDIVFDSVLQEFLQDIAWIWIPFVVALLGVNLAVARFGLRPLRLAARQAATIGPGNFSVRLPTGKMPTEILALVTAVNRALDRLEAEFAAQRAFIADAAHELRTPVAVLKAHVGILPQFSGLTALKEEVGALERLVTQLLDSARLDSLKVGTNDAADLNAVAADVAAYLAPLAIQKNRSIEVVSKGVPIPIRGSADFLFRALRNLVENAINHTPEGTTVKIIVDEPPVISVVDRGPGVPQSEREAIFQRFWQGRRDRGGGAGLGMDIAARTVVAHGGTLTVEDAAGGGAVFNMRFPQDKTATP